MHVVEQLVRARVQVVHRRRLERDDPDVRRAGVRDHLIVRDGREHHGSPREIGHRRARRQRLGKLARTHEHDRGFRRQRNGLQKLRKTAIGDQSALVDQAQARKVRQRHRCGVVRLRRVEHDRRQLDPVAPSEFLGDEGVDRDYRVRPADEPRFLATPHRRGQPRERHLMRSARLVEVERFRVEFVRVVHESRAGGACRADARGKRVEVVRVN